MDSRGFRFALACLAASYAFLSGVIAAGYHYFPGPIATHFGADGRPNGWMTRDECAQFLAGVGIAGPGVILLVVFLGSGMTLRHFHWNNRAVEIPRGRSPEVRLFLRTMGLGYASLLVLFISGGQICVLISNLGSAPAHLNRYVFGIVLALFITGNALVSWRLIRYFLALAKAAPRERDRF